MVTGASIVAKMDEVKAEIAASGKKYGCKETPTPAIVAVTKTHGEEKILPLLKKGHRVFAENRVQEAQSKWPELKEEYPDIELHLIGPLQTNKVKEALALFDVIQTVDREKLARELKKEMEKAGKKPKLFIQVNTGKEPQKAGVMPEEADKFITECKTLFGKQLVGLMCIPPVEEEPSPHFALLKKIADRNGLKALSMGMSGDFAIAAALGATHVRVGSAIFGERG